MDKIINISNIEVYEFCKLNILTGERIFYNNYSKFDKFDGFYFKNEEEFFAIYASDNGPNLYYNFRVYPLNKKLHITLKKMGDWREFSIGEYNIHIRYRTSKYIGFDVWSEEEDVDLFYQIEQNYKNDDYYKKFTK